MVEITHEIYHYNSLFSPRTRSVISFEIFGKKENFIGVEKDGRFPVSGHKNYGVLLRGEGLSGAY